MAAGLVSAGTGASLPFLGVPGFAIGPAPNGCHPYEHERRTRTDSVAT
jgi:hypothetical protein